jgi:hypothetical protein
LTKGTLSYTTKSIQITSEETFKLRQISEKLKKNLTNAKKSYDKAIEKLKFKKNAKGGDNINEKEKEKEIQLIQVQIKEAQKTIQLLKLQIDANPSIDKYINNESN